MFSNVGIEWLVDTEKKINFNRKIVIWLVLKWIIFWHKNMPWEFWTSVWKSLSCYTIFQVCSVVLSEIITKKETHIINLESFVVEYSFLNIIWIPVTLAEKNNGLYLHMTKNFPDTYICHWKALQEIVKDILNILPPKNLATELDYFRKKAVIFDYNVWVMVFWTPQ